MDQEPRIVCVYKTGGDFTTNYVRILADGVRRHCGMDLHCLSDDPAVAEYAHHIPIKHDWPKWWPKLEVFSHFNHALYVDLDTIIKRDARNLLDDVQRFTMARGFATGAGRGNSSVMAWRGDYSYLPAKFDTSMIPAYSRPRIAWGDQDFINDHLGFTPDYFQDTHPGFIASRKKDCIMARRECGILCYHGRPRPHQTNWSPL